MNTTTATNILTTCNACDTEAMHNDCEMGYCTNCCPAH